MRNSTWVKKGILCGLAVICFMMGGTVQAEAGWVGLSLRKKALEESMAAKEEEIVSAKEQELKEKKKELEELKTHTIQYMVSCTYCGGSGKSSTICKRCNGSGVADIPGNLSLVISCGSCMGNGRERCAMCMNGKMTNPDYFAQCDARDEKIKKLEEEIAQLEGKEVSDLVPTPSPTPNPNPIPAPIPYPEPTSNFEVSADCVRCKGTGKVTCSSCKGTGYLEKTHSAADYSGKGSNRYTTTQSCYCDNGYRSCTLCGGTGKH